MLFKPTELEGAWEEPGVIGMRIEIYNSFLTVLWRNSPVLETRFKVKKNGERIEILPKSRGFRYKNDISDYAEMKGLCYEGGTLTLIEHFPITGDSTTELKKTDRSRYGNYIIADEALCELQGAWRDESCFLPLVFKGNVMYLNDKKIRIHLLRADDRNATAELRIVDVDPSVYKWDGLFDFVYDGTKITAQFDVCDASPIRFVFRKQ